MYEKSINQAEIILKSQKENTIPVRKLWEDVKKLATVNNFEVASLADFSAMLEGDKRFLIIPATQDIDELLLNDVEMENLGFYSEDQVKLATSTATEQNIINEDEEEIGSIRRKAFVSHNNKIITKKTTRKTKQTKVKNKSTSKTKNKNLKPIKSKKQKK